jgi:hypothetical protein
MPAHARRRVRVDHAGCALKLQLRAQNLRRSTQTERGSLREPSVGALRWDPFAEMSAACNR